MSLDLKLLQQRLENLEKRVKELEVYATFSTHAITKTILSDLLEKANEN